LSEPVPPEPDRNSSRRRVWGQRPGQPRAAHWVLVSRRSDRLQPDQRHSDQRHSDRLQPDRLQPDPEV